MTTGLTSRYLMDTWGLRAHTARHVSALAHGHELVVTSGLRSATRNRQVGGVAGSMHLSGRAVDLTGDLWTLDHLRGVALRAGAKEALVEFRGTRRQHLHVAW